MVRYCLDTALCTVISHTHCAVCADYIHWQPWSDTLNWDGRHYIVHYNDIDNQPLLYDIYSAIRTSCTCAVCTDKIHWQPRSDAAETWHDTEEALVSVACCVGLSTAYHCAEVVSLPNISPNIVSDLFVHTGHRRTCSDDTDPMRTMWQPSSPLRIYTRP